MRLSLHIKTLIVTLLCTAHAAFAASVRVSGRALQYAGHNIEVATYADYITKLDQSLACIQVDKNGRFSADIELAETTYAYFDLGAYKAYIYLEPGTDIEIVLPPYKPRPDADRFNPFFKQELIEVGIKDGDTGLNGAVRHFEAYFNRAYNRDITRIVRGRDLKLADRLIHNCDSVAKMLNSKLKNKSPFLSNYARFRMAQVYMTPRMGQVRGVISKYFNKEVQYNVPTYWEALQMLCPDFLANSRVYTKSDMLRALQTNSFKALTAALEKDTAYRRADVSEALLLNGLYDAYYGDKLSLERTDTLLMQAESVAARPASRLIATNIRQKINRLRYMSPAPDFKLNNIKTKNDITLPKLKGKFVYLCFLNSQSVACRRDMSALESMQRKYGRDMTVVGVMTDRNRDKIDEYFKAHKIQWTAATLVGDESMLINYNITALPQYVLIDPEGRLAAAPSPAPSENVEQVIGNAMMRYKKEQLKKQIQKSKDIYDMQKHMRPPT